MLDYISREENFSPVEKNFIFQVTILTKKKNESHAIFFSGDNFLSQFLVSICVFCWHKNDNIILCF